MTTARQALF